MFLNCLTMLAVAFDFQDGDYLGVLYAESGQTLRGLFSAVSKPNFASKYSLEFGSVCKED